MQQSKFQQSSCQLCHQKEEVIRKYTQLVGLMKKKQDKREESRMKESIGSLASLEGQVVGWAVRGEKMRHAIEKVVMRRLQDGTNGIMREGVHHRETFIGRQSTIASSLADKSSLKGQHLSTNPQNVQKAVESLGLLNSPSSSMEAFKPQFLEELFKFTVNLKSHPKKVFQLSINNTMLTSKIQLLKKEISENQRRQEKEISKKRESLQGLVEQLSEKNDIIIELKESVKVLEGRLFKKGDMSNRMLEEDGQGLKRALTKLQGSNDRLNMDIVKLKEEKSLLEKDNKEFKTTNDNLKSEIKFLKEQLFVFQHQHIQLNLQKRQFQLISQKLSAKTQKLKRMERKYNEISKIRDSVSTAEAGDSERKVQIESTSNVENRVEENDMENKLEAIFNFLFNIQDEKCVLGEVEAFDDEEKELLVMHKERFLRNAKTNKVDIITPVSSKDVNADHNLADFGESVLDMFISQPVPTIAPPSVNIKLIQFELQRTKLIEKISQLKERHLHMRSVILQFLKSLDLRNLKKQAQGILIVICEIFEYSQEQRAVINESRTRKFFGFI